MPDPNTLPLVRIADTTGNPTNPSGGGTSGGTQAAPFYDILVSDTAGTQPLGAPTDAATASGATTSVIGALRAIRDKLLGSVAVTEANGANVALGSTADAANASTVVGQLKQSNANSAYTQSPLSFNGSVAASGVIFTPERDAGLSPSPYASYRVLFKSDQAGTLTVQAKTTAGGANSVVRTVAVAANTQYDVVVPVLSRIFATVFNNGATAATSVTLLDGFTTN